jgi:hypothetical protein
VKERITAEAIEALEKLGVGAAVNELGFLLRSDDGVGNHGEEGWRSNSNHELTGKMVGHVPSPKEVDRAFDPDSRRLSVAHAVVRGLMLLQRGVEGLRHSQEKAPLSGAERG